MRYFGLKKEAEYGDLVDGPLDRYEGYATENIQLDPNYVIPAPTAHLSYRKRQRGLYRAQGPVVFPVSPNSVISDVLKGVFGKVETTTPAGDVKLHTYTPQAELPSYTMRVGIEKTERVLPGCLFESLTLRYRPGEPLEAEASVYSGIEEQADTPLTWDDLKGRLDPLEFFTQLKGKTNFTIGTDDDRMADVTSFDVTIANNINFTAGDLESQYYNVLERGPLEVTGNLELRFRELTDFNNFKAGTPFDFIAVLSGKNIEGAYDYSIGLNLYQLQILREGAPPLRAMDEPLRINAPFQAFYDPTENLEVKAFVQNTITPY